MVSDKVFNTDGTQKIFSSDFAIISEDHIRVYLGAAVVSRDDYDLINNAAVFNVAPTAGQVMTVQVGTTPADILTSPTDAGIVSANIADVNTVAANIPAINTANANSVDVTTVATDIANVNTTATDIANVNTTATNIADVNTVATNIAKVNTVADDIVKVIKVADDLNEAISEVETVADDLNEAVSEIEVVANDIANVNTVGTNIANVNTVAGISGNVTTVAGISANTTTVAGISADVTTTAGISANVTTVAGISANTTTVAGISADVTTVAGVSGNVTTVATNIADVNNYADQYIGSAAADPTTRTDSSALLAGDLYFNNTVDELRVYSGTQWIAGTAGTLAVQNFSGDGSTVAFTLSTAPSSENNTQVYINGIYQQKDGYSVSGTTLTFSVAPPLDTNNIEVVTVSTLALGNTTSDLVEYDQGGTGSVVRTVEDKLQESVSVKDFGAVGDGVTDDTAAINKAVATGKRITGDNLTYKVTPDTIIDTFATAGIGYGENKKWFIVADCSNIKFIGDISFGSGSAFFLGKHKTLEDVHVTGKARFSSWYVTYSGFTVSDITYMGGDLPPDKNWVGFYYNTFTSCLFQGGIFIDQRYGPVNLNSFIECRINGLTIHDTGNTGYTLNPAKDTHQNVFMGCEFRGDALASDSNTYDCVADESASIGGVNKIISPYLELGSRGVYGNGWLLENVHTSAGTGGITSGGSAKVGFQTPVSGGNGFLSRSVPNVQPIGQLCTGGDWSILNSDGYPVCLSSSNHTVTTGTDSTEPTGIHKYVQFSSAVAFAPVNFLFDTETSDSFKTFAFIIKTVSGSFSVESFAADGTTIYGDYSITDLGNNWKMYYGTSYRSPRITSTAAYTVQISAISGGRGAGLISPFGVKKPLIDLSGVTTSHLDDFMSSYQDGYKRSKVTGSIINADGTVTIATLAFGNWQGKVAEITLLAKCKSGAGGVRVEYRKYIVRETGGAALSITELTGITTLGGNMTVSATGAGSTLSMNLATSVASSESFSYIVEVNSDINVDSNFNITYS